MWSGPRNISTALMRAWENRPDTIVVDEPLYAHYLKMHPVDHPGVDEVVATHESDWRVVAEWLTSDDPLRNPPRGYPSAVGQQRPARGPDATRPVVFYQKHMAHHLLPQIEHGWLDRLTHVFLIRDPAEMLTSLVKQMPNPTLADTGLPQQVELFESFSQETRPAAAAILQTDMPHPQPWAAVPQTVVPFVIDARDVLENPRRMLGLLCDALGVEFREEMLHWPAGRRATDGVWAKHWYAAVEKSTRFEPYRPKGEPVPAGLGKLLEECRPLYERLWRERLR